ncbi:hypothetical protein Ancab_034297 [Ancistrocladus abbreviatus]
MEGSRRCKEPEFNLQEWHQRARISRENTSSRRFSASYIRSFREDTRSFRSNFTISSTASSPGYHLMKDEIDPSSYSFTAALKALQARSGCVWEYLSPEGFALNSKWDEAERYICNPLSGEVPMECLSAKTLSGRSFRNMIASRITMSAPLVYSKRVNSVPSMTAKEEDHKSQFRAPDKQMGSKARDVGTQSNPPEQSSCCPSPASPPSKPERSLKLCETKDGDASNSGAKCNSLAEENPLELESKKEKAEGSELVDKHIQVEQEKEATKKEEEEEQRQQQKTEQQCCSCRQSGCFALGGLWMKKRHRGEHKSSRVVVIKTHATQLACFS